MHRTCLVLALLAATVVLTAGLASSQTPRQDKTQYRKFDAGSTVYYVDVNHIRRYAIEDNKAAIHDCANSRGVFDFSDAQMKCAREKTRYRRQAEVIVYPDTGGGPYEMMNGVQQWRFTCDEPRQRMTVLGSAGLTTYVPPGSIMAEIGAFACAGG